ncbi:10319_t:CDS:2, partial [Dentiscutata erythropus]
LDLDSGYIERQNLELQTKVSFETASRVDIKSAGQPGGLAGEDSETSFVLVHL